MNENYRFTAHARQRCAEMGISTKRAKRVLRQPDILAPNLRDPSLMVARGDGISVIFNPTRKLVVTVVWCRPGVVGTREEITRLVTCGS